MKKRLKTRVGIFINMGGNLDETVDNKLSSQDLKQ